MTEIFEDSKLKLTRARYHLESLTADMKEYAATAKIVYEPIVGDDENVIFKIEPDASKSFALIIGDIVHNIRSALDILICDIGRMRGCKSSEKFFFPFPENEKAFNGEMNNQGSRYHCLNELNNDVIDKLKAFRPYKENGNVDLKGLHDLDIIDKHKLVLSTVCGWLVDLDYNKGLTPDLI